MDEATDLKDSRNVKDVSLFKTLMHGPPPAQHPTLESAWITLPCVWVQSQPSKHLGLLPDLDSVKGQVKVIHT